MSSEPLIRTLHLEGKELFDHFVSNDQPIIRYSRTYINNSSEKIFVLHRNNLSLPFKATLDLRYPQGDFIVRSTWQFNGYEAVADVKKSIQNTLAHHGLVEGDLKILDARIREMWNRNHTNPRVTVIIDRQLPVRVIKEMGAAYLHDEDVVLCLADKAHTLAHPYSSGGVIDPEQRDYISRNNVSGFFVELIDNERNVSSRFMYVGKKVVEVPSSVDHSRKSGIYFNYAQNHPLSGAHLEKQFCTLEEAEGTVGLYRTRDEAMSGGNPDIISKTDYENAKREAAESALQLERARNENAVQKEELERLRNLRADYYEERKYQRSDNYEQRSASRKDSSEILKISAAAIGAGLAVFGYMKKNKS